MPLNLIPVYPIDGGADVPSLRTLGGTDNQATHLNVFNLKDYGGNGDWDGLATPGGGVTDNLGPYLAAMQAIDNFFNPISPLTLNTQQSVALYIPPGHYYFSDTMRINRSIEIIGGGGSVGSLGCTTLVFAQNKPGVEFVAPGPNYNVHTIQRVVDGGSSTGFTTTIELGANITSASRTSNVTTLVISENVGPGYNYGVGTYIYVNSTDVNFTSGVYAITGATFPFTITYREVAPDQGSVSNIGNVVLVNSAKTLLDHGFEVGYECNLDSTNINFTDGFKVITAKTAHSLSYEDTGPAVGPFSNAGILNAGRSPSALLKNVVVRSTSNNSANINPDAHGVQMRWTFNKMENVFVRGFSGNGIEIGGSTPYSGSNHWSLINCSSTNNKGHGLYVAGGDSSAGVAMRFNSSDNNKSGIWDGSFLGNTYIGCHTRDNNQNNLTSGGPQPVTAANITSVASSSHQTTLVIDQATVIRGNYFGTNIKNSDYRTIPSAAGGSYFSEAVIPTITVAGTPYITGGMKIITADTDDIGTANGFTIEQISRYNNETTVVATGLSATVGSTITIVSNFAEFSSGVKTVTSALPGLIAYAEAGADAGTISFEEDRYSIAQIKTPATIGGAGSTELALKPRVTPFNYQVGYIVNVTGVSGVGFTNGDKTITAIGTTTVGGVVYPTIEYAVGSDPLSTTVAESSLTAASEVRTPTIAPTVVAAGTVKPGGASYKITGSVNESAFIGCYAEGSQGTDTSTYATKNGGAWTWNGNSPAFVAGGANVGVIEPRFGRIGTMLSGVSGFANPSKWKFGPNSSAGSQPGGGEYFNNYQIGSSTDNSFIRSFRAGPNTSAFSFASALVGPRDMGDFEEMASITGSESGTVGGKGWVHMINKQATPANSACYAFSGASADQGGGHFLTPNKHFMGPAMILSFSSTEVEATPAPPVSANHQRGTYQWSTRVEFGKPAAWVNRINGTPFPGAARWEPLAYYNVNTESNTATEGREYLLTTTSPTAVITHTPYHANGKVNDNFVVYVYYRVITGATDVTITLTWTDQTGAQSFDIVPLTSTPVGVYPVSPVYINAKSTGAITVTGTASVNNRVYISSTIQPVS